MATVSVILLLLLAGALVYSALSVVAAIRYLGAPSPPVATMQEPMSVLKPLAGLDEGLEENLRSFFEQDYPNFEIILAARFESDPCVPLVRRLCAEYPEVTARFLLVGEPAYPHAKVYSLARLMGEARHDLIVMSDSDIRVARNFLQRVSAEFQDGETALATCPYRAEAGSSIWSKLEAQGMNTTFWQGVLTARLLDGMKFAVGPTVVARRNVIEAIGGMEGLKDYLAEDFEMGKRVAEAGFRVMLSFYVVEHRIGSETAAQNFAHRIRWGRTSRRSRPAGYFGQIFTYPLPLALLVWGANPQWWHVVATTIVLRYASAWMTSQVVLGARLNWVLLPIEDVLGFVFWFAGFFGNTILWRGRKYRMDREGRVVV